MKKFYPKILALFACLGTIPKMSYRLEIANKKTGQLEDPVEIIRGFFAGDLRDPEEFVTGLVPEVP